MLHGHRDPWVASRPLTGTSHTAITSIAHVVPGHAPGNHSSFVAPLWVPCAPGCLSPSSSPSLTPQSRGLSGEAAVGFSEVMPACPGAAKSGPRPDQVSLRLPASVPEGWVRCNRRRVHKAPSALPAFPGRAVLVHGLHAVFRLLRVPGWKTRGPPRLPCQASSVECQRRKRFCPTWLI